FRTHRRVAPLPPDDSAPSREELEMRIPLMLAVLLGLLLPHPAAAQSQITTGVIAGSVIDATGAALPGVTVEVRNLDTNLARTTVSGADGRFVFLQLPPGHYKATFTLAGFATLVQEDIELTVGSTMTLNAPMKVSGVSETLTVKAESPIIEASRTGTASTLNQVT